MAAPRKFLHLFAFLIISLAFEGRSEPTNGNSSGTTQITDAACDSYQADREEWCPTITPQVCGDAGEVGRSVRSVCPTSCKICLVGGSAQDAELAKGGVVEFRTGRIARISEPETPEQSVIDGWQLWLEHSGALEDGFSVGNGRVKVKHTDIFLPQQATCEEHIEAAKRLAFNHQVQAATLRAFGPCSTNVSMALHESGVLHLEPTGPGFKTNDGQQYINKHLWDPTYDITQYPINFLGKMRFYGHKRVAVVYSEGYNTLKTLAHYIINNTIPGMAELEVVYTFGWPSEKGGSAISKDPDSYVEAYDTALWDRMLTGAREAGSEVLLIYGHGEAGSIVKRMKALDVTFSGVFATFAPLDPLWPKLMGADGELVVTGGQWHPALQSTCKMFGSSANYSGQFEARFGRPPDYHAALESNIGLILQYAIQAYNSVSTDTILAGLQTLDEDTFFGHVKFSYRQRNIGQTSTITMQHQGGVLRLVLPEQLAETKILPFMNWRCRSLYAKSARQPCTDADLNVHEYCKSRYSILDVSACEARAVEQEQAANWRRLVTVAIPCALGGIALLALFAVWLHGQHRRYLQEQAIRIKFSELRIIPLSHASSAGSFSALGVPQTTKRTLKYADLRGTKVLLRDRSKIGVEPSEPELVEPDSPTRLATIAIEEAEPEPEPSDPAPQPSRLRLTKSVKFALSGKKPVSFDAQEPAVSRQGSSNRAMGRRKSIKSRPSFIQWASKGSLSPSTSIKVPMEETVRQEPVSDGKSKMFCIRKRTKDFIWLPGNILAATNLKHKHLLPILGITTDKQTGTEYIVTESMPLGSMRELLQHDQIGVRDISTLLGIIKDIISGLRYLHEAKQPFIHGDLRAKNVLLDEKLTAKIRTDVRPISLSRLKDMALQRKSSTSMHSFRSALSSSIRSRDSSFATGLRTAWTAPEILSMGQPSTKTDIYALGMTIWELFAKSSPYGEMGGCSDPMELPNQLVSDILNSDLRPTMPDAMPVSIQEAVKDCLSQDPLDRPSLEELNSIVASVRRECRTKYKDKLNTSEQLLHQMLPPHVAAALRDGRKVEPQLFECVTVFFSDIVGYTDMTATMRPEKVMDLLDRLYQRFDKLSRKHGLFKVETIGDAYMCVGGIPEAQENHTARVAKFALEAVKAANSVRVDQEDPSQGVVNIRAGFHSGSVIASVVGDLNPRYCLFGDTVNTASRMESNSEMNKINMSPDAHELLQVQGNGLFLTESRGEIDIKGKGSTECFFLTGEGRRQTMI